MNAEILKKQLVENGSSWEEVLLASGGNEPILVDIAARSSSLEMFVESSFAWRSSVKGVKYWQSVAEGTNKRQYYMTWRENYEDYNGWFTYEDIQKELTRLVGTDCGEFDIDEVTIIKGEDVSENIKCSIVDLIPYEVLSR